MNGADYIHFAGKIAATYSEAASCRSAISRAYYGAFHVAKSFLAQVGSSAPRNANVHVFVQHRLANSGNERAAKAGSHLSDLHSDRIDADYHLENRSAENLHYARDAVALAEEIRRLISECDREDIRQEIRSGIVEYERKISGG